jgi:predicted RND superfamily exporter protein
MKVIVSTLASVARRFPWAVVAVAAPLTVVFVGLAHRIEVATGNEGFAPEGPEIAAAERIGEIFGDGSSESTFQVIIRAEGGDVISVAGLRTVMAAVEAIRESELGDHLASRPGRPGVVHYLLPVTQTMGVLQIPLEDMTDEMVKDFYIEALDGDGEFDAAPEDVSFLTRMVAEDFDPQEISASSGLALAFVGGFEGADAEEAFQAQSEAELAAAEVLAELDGPLDIRPFSFALLLSGADDFLDEVGRLFALAFVVILVILLFVYWLSPGKEGSWFASARRTMTDALLTLLTIVMAIFWMQGIGYLLQQAGVITAFSSVTQIVPILLIGLGVDYAIHLTSRYRELIGSGATVDGAMSGAVTSVGVALVLATVTTVIGFLTNLFNPVPALQDFGVLAAVGIVVAFLLMLTFVPAVRILADRRAERGGALAVHSLRSHGDRLLPKIMEKLAVLAERAAIPTLVVALVLGGAGYYGFTNLDTRFSFTDFLPEDSPYVEALAILEDDFGGGLGEQTQVLVEGEIDAGVHNALVKANQALADVSDVSIIETPQGPFPNAASPISLLGRLLSGAATPPELLAAAQQVGLRPDLTVAEGADVTPLYLALTQVAPEEADRVIALDGERIVALLWDITTTAGDQVEDLRGGLDAAFLGVNELGVSAVATSQNIIGNVVISKLTDSQSRSLFITVAVSGLVLIISFMIESRRWALGLITIAPVALVVLWTYGLMFATGIPFGPVTATLSALAIGIGVPFTIHIARRFQEDRRAYDDMDEAMRSTMRHTGGALAGSAFTTMAGFGVLMTSSLLPFRQMGQVTVYAIGLSLVAAVLVLPSMLALWDGYHRQRGDERIGSEMREKDSQVEAAL